MPSTHFSEAALERRREKFAYAADFPGLLHAAPEAVGKTVASVVSAGEVSVVVFTDGCFLLAAPGPASGDALLAAIQASAGALAPWRSSELAELERRVDAEQEAMRFARMEKVLGAVETNLPRVPELRDELRKLLDAGP